MAEILIESKHEYTGKTALVEQSDRSAWLYICGSNGIERDAFVFSKVEPNEVFDRAELEAGSPPTLVKKYASPNSVLCNVTNAQLELRWSFSGESVAVMFLGEPIAMIVAHEPKGFSKALIGESGFGVEWDEAVYRECFINS